jgi:hypothetical protein
LSCVEAPAFKELGGYQKAIDYLNRLPEVKGWVTHNLCPRNDEVYDPTRDRLFFKRRNGMRIDAIRQQIATWQAQGAIDDEAQWKIDAIQATIDALGKIVKSAESTTTAGAKKSPYQGLYDQLIGLQNKINLSGGNVTSDDEKMYALLIDKLKSTTSGSKLVDSMGLKGGKVVDVEHGVASYEGSNLKDISSKVQDQVAKNTGITNDKLDIIILTILKNAILFSSSNKN